MDSGVDKTLTYRSVLFRKTGESRFIATATVIQGWNIVQEVPKTINIESVSTLDPYDTVSITKRAYRMYDDTMTPSMPTNVIVQQGGREYEGILVKRFPDGIGVITQDGLTELSIPYNLKYTSCMKSQCKPILPRIGLYFESNINEELVPVASNRGSALAPVCTPGPNVTCSTGTIRKSPTLSIRPSSSLPVADTDRQFSNESSSVDLTFSADGFSWSAFYKAFFDFTAKYIVYLSADISCVNKTELPLIDVDASFVSKSDEVGVYEYRPRAMAAGATMSRMSQATPSSEQTTIGSTVYTLGYKVTVEEKSTSTFNLAILKNIPMVSHLMLNIADRPDHPYTIVRFTLPEKVKDGLPAGPIECWEHNNKQSNTTQSNKWLTNTNMPIAAPGEEIILELGENSFVEVNVSMTINRLREENISKEVESEETDDFGNAIQVIQRSSYKVSVTIVNRSDRNVELLPFHPIYREPTEFQSSLDAHVATPKHGGLRVEFKMLELKPNDKYTIQYSMIA